MAFEEKVLVCSFTNYLDVVPTFDKVF
jgi:hypothetical protein